MFRHARRRPGNGLQAGDRLAREARPWTRSRLEVFRPLARRAAAAGARMVVGTLGAAEAAGVEPVAVAPGRGRPPELPSTGMKLRAR